MGRFVLPLQQVFTSSGRLGAGYQLHFYQSGTSTPLDTYADSGLATANSNPVVADADGRFNDIWLADQPYKVTLSDADDALVWSADPVQSATGELGVPIPVNKGGTGAATAAAARTNLGLGTASTYDVGTDPDEVPTNANVSGVPTGAILLWSGSSGSIPSGWALCNGGTYSKVDGSGTLVSPDLRDRFVIGATSTYAVGSSGGSSSGTTGAAGAVSGDTGAGGDHTHGGTEGHTLTTAQMPNHQHFLFKEGAGEGTGIYPYRAWFPGHNTQYNIQGQSSVPDVYKSELVGGGGSHSHGIPASGTHTHAVTIPDHTHTVASLPPFFSLCYIIKL